MLKLSDFFQPLNLLTLFYFAGFILFFDFLGSFVKGFFIKDKKINTETRLVNWLMGLGFFIFVWFILGFFIVPDQKNLLISAIFLFVISIPAYIKKAESKTLLSSIKTLIIPILLVLPLLPSTFVKASLPPYVWDEMAYHFISPYVMLNQISNYWIFSGGLYSNLPRLIDTFYILSFSVTHTYSVARLIQFCILITSLFMTFSLTKKIFGWVSATLFLLIFLSLPFEIPFNATIGYVDFPAFAFLLLGLTLGITFLFTNAKDHLILSFIFWMMALATKYTMLIPFGSFAVAFLVVYWIKNRSFKRLFSKRLFLATVAAFILFGGYWYIKNFVVYGNPIYPFIFPCWGRFAAACAQGSSFFGTWTSSIDLNTLFPILDQLLPNNSLLLIAIFISPLYVILFGNRQNKLLILFFALSLGIDTIILKFFSGFVLRYQQYAVFEFLFVIILFSSEKFALPAVRLRQSLFIFILFASALFFYSRNMIYLNSANFVHRNEFNYAVGKENIYDWTNSILPATFGVIKWCEDLPNPPVAVSQADPDMIWSSYEGLMRVYLVNCYLTGVPLEAGTKQSVLSVAIKNKLKFWLVSLNTCAADGNTKYKNSTDITAARFADLNNILVCNSKEVKPNLYYFDYSNLKQQ